jgi:hypothetical protein
VASVIGQPIGGRMAGGSFTLRSGMVAPDLQPPVIHSLDASPVTITTATLRWTVSEPVSVRLAWARDGGTPATWAASAIAASGTLTLDHLDPETSYSVSLTATDPAGHVATSSVIFTTASPPNPDTTPPVGTLAINGGNHATRERETTLSLFAADDSEMVAQMRLSNDGVTYAAPQPYATAMPWLLDAGDGLKTVFAQFSDGSRNWSLPVAATILLDTTPPALAVTSPQDGALLGSATLRLAPRPLAVGSLRIPPHGQSPWGSTSSDPSAAGRGALRGGLMLPMYGRVGDDQPIRGLTFIGQPGGGVPVRARPLPSGARTIVVEGVTDDPTPWHWPAGPCASRSAASGGCARAWDDPAAVIVANGRQAVVSGTTYRAEGILLTEGANTIAVTASDAVGNAATINLTVYLDTHPPARPTVWVPTVLPSGTVQTLTGAKPAGTSVWLWHEDGQWTELVPLSDATVWAVMLATLDMLQEGDNTLRLVAKDEAGNLSTVQTLTVIVDHLPPVVTMEPPQKTNITPLILQGTVDDSATIVAVNGVAAYRTRRAFHLTILLTPGVNALHVKAVSPHGHVTEVEALVTLGTIPTIRSFTPSDGAIVYAETPAVIRIDAADADADPIEYQVRLDGAPVSDWVQLATPSWTPNLETLGARALTAAVRDGYGGEHVQAVEVYVARQPVEAP